MKINVLAIAPYVGLRDLLLEMVQEETAIHMDVEVADLQEAIPLVQLAEERGYNMIVSRGGTASLIRQHSSLPVVDIPVSGYDILRVLTLVRKANSKVAIIGFPNICKAVSEVSSLLEFKIPTFSIGDPSEVKSALRQAFQSDVKIVLGDAVTVRAAQEMGYHGILITSGRESVSDMFQEVSRVFDVYRRGQEKVMFYREILDNDARAIFALDQKKNVTYINKAAGNMIGGKPEEDVCGSSIQLLFPVLYKLIQQFEETPGTKDLLQQFLHVNDQQYKVSVTAHGTVGPFHYLVSLDSIENWRNERRFAAYIPSRITTFNQLVGSSSILKKTILRASKYAQTDRNVWISGEKGTGKSMFAQAIHSASKRHDLGFYMISCEEMTEQELDGLLMGTKEELSLPETGFAGTLYLNNVDRLDRVAQDKWLQVVKHYKSIRFVASSSTTLNRLRSRADVNHDLIMALSELHFTIPPLRERVEDLDEIVRVIIASYNSQSGKQIVGFRDSAMDELMQYHWAGNLRELVNAIHEMLILTKGNYVESKEAALVIDRYRQSANLNIATASTQIDLRGTMEEIERRIITHVLQEEGMNQSQTCKRLGINRTTLWRKLNKALNNET
ncbi:sigma-54-dependent Fis family transcriptional regulator [Paenibacillus sp. V4I5]|uniref:sigma-54-dependent Fis family transcriptional regulator n=1 Tax=Paenibacillus sp. V4I5 TaxID=3042306 RepID=UPI002794F819|nr:PrpR N-terminal domain-containing protein [Paenibacillus sp. V4I5]MDQ0920673.1 propionate catabolism operon transcriptional regulator [Paenibacillus sp. V4I5]